MKRDVKHVKTPEDYKLILFNMRVSKKFLDLLDDWRVKRRPILSRSEAIRRLVEDGMR